jgi:hypothetical protein
MYTDEELVWLYTLKHVDKGYRGYQSTLHLSHKRKEKKRKEKKRKLDSPNSHQPPAAATDKIYTHSLRALFFFLSFFLSFFLFVPQSRL